MKQFFKFIFASCLGSLLAIGVIFFILFAAATSSETIPPIESNSVLELRLNEAIPELTDNIAANQFGYSEGGAIGLNDIIRLIRKASSDRKIGGLYLRTENVFVNPTTAYAIAREIDSFKASGKFVYAYGDYFTQSGYIIAAVADSIFLNPNGVVDLRGYGSARPYYEEFSEKTGIDFDVYHAGKYKSAIEPYYRGESSKENRFQTKRYLSSFHNALVEQIATHRDIEIDVVNEIITEGLSNNIENALNFGLVDEAFHAEDVEDKMSNALETSKCTLVNLETYYYNHPKDKSNNDNKIAVIYAEGEVASGGEIKGAISMDVYDEIFDRIEESSKIKAVVLRVNSPGGSSFTSDRFLKRVKDLKKAGKYVVASFGDYAASGGYYVAAEANRIISEPTCLTGSIGVFSMIPDFSEISEEEFGIHWDTIATGKRTFLYSTFVGRSAQDNALLMGETERVYEQFKKVVAEGRGLSLEEVEEVAQGRVWTGTDAIQAGLVDTLGSLSDAINIAVQEMGFEDDYKILEYPIIEKDFWDLLVENYASNILMDSKVDKVLSPLMKEMLLVVSSIEEASKTPQARMPYSIMVN